MIEKEQALQGEYKFSFKWMLYVPLVLLIGVVPLIVRMTVLPIQTELANLMGRTHVIDFYTQYKAGAIYVLAGVIVILLFLVFDKNKIKKDKYFKTYYICIGVFGGATLLAAFLSTYQSIALWGIAERAEGAMINICYLLMMLYVIYLVEKEKDSRYILFPLVVLVIITTIIGVFQYAGQDILLETQWGQRLIVPEQYKAYRGEIVSTLEKGKIYGTMFHYNYVGSFGAMIVPLFITLALFTKDKRTKIILGIVSLCSIFILFGSTSRAGIIGLVSSCIMFLVIFGKIIIKKWKMIIPSIIVICMVIMGLDKITGGTIFGRIPSLVNDAIELFVPSDIEGDYKDDLVIRDIKHVDKKMVVYLQKGNLTIQEDTRNDNNLKFSDQEGNEVKFSDDGTGYTTDDERFSSLIFKRQEHEKSSYQDFSINIGGMDLFYFRVEEDVHLIDRITLERIELEEAESIGFKNKLELGSARGYIWSRSLPMLEETWLIGHGPDTYVLEFPQNDLLAKWKAYGTTNMLVTKPHNLYLQIAINQGGIALVAFLVLIGTYIVQSIRLYALRKNYSQRDIIGIGIMLGITGYLGAGIFNDSEISVAPIFWILLGLGMAINYIGNQERVKETKDNVKKVVAMKSRR